MEIEESRVAALRDEIERLRAALQRAGQEAQIDALTGCLNRRGWARSIEGEERRCARHGLDAVVVMVDLDGLKATNDDHGHAAGDERIVECARTLQSVVRSEDPVARLGGDEFAILAVQTTPAAPQAVAGHIERALDAAGVRASVGWALRSAQNGLEAAVVSADHCMLMRKRHQDRAHAR
jgi:diguanylate cyclase